MCLIKLPQITSQQMKLYKNNYNNKHYSYSTFDVNKCPEQKCTKVLGFPFSGSVDISV